MIEKRVITPDGPRKSSKRNIPKVIKWKGVNMVRNQSFLSGIKEIIDYSAEMDVVRIGIIGDMNSGKTTLAKSVGHAIHTHAKIPYTVKIFYKEDLKDFKKTMSKLSPTNYVLIFDDVSFLKSSASAKEITQIESEISTIRHMEGGQDVKIIIMFNFHYPKALPPFLREFQYKFITSIGTDNEKTIADNFGRHNVDKVKEFKMARKKAITQKVWFERIGPNEPIKYNFRNPFIPVLFWNESTLRKMVSPTRYFMDKICSLCDEAEGNKVYDDKTIGQVCDQGEVNFTKGNFKAAIKLLLHVHGVTVYGKKVTRALRWIENERKARNMPLAAFASHYDMEETKTRVRAKPFDELPE